MTRYVARCGRLVAAMAIILFSQASRAAEPVSYDIPAQGASTALLAFADASRLRFFASASDLAGVRTKPLVGRYTPEDALRVMLEGTGLVATISPDGTITIRRAASPAVRPITGTPEQPFTATDFKPATASATDSGADADTGLAEITVTARRREETLVDIPLAISAFTERQLEAAGVRNLEDISSLSPGLNFTSQGSTVSGRVDTNVRMRGVAINSFRPDRQLASVFIDGIFVAGGVHSLGVEDLERVEVIRGPQSALFGRSTFAGAINYVTKKPARDFSGKARLELAQFGRVDASLTHEGPVVEDRLYYRATVRGFRYDGQYRNSVDGTRLGEQETNSAALALHGTPSERLEFTARAFYYEDQDGPPVGYSIGQAYFNCGPFTDPVTGMAGTDRYICGDLPVLPDSAIGRNNDFTPRLVDLLVNDSTGQSYIIDPKPRFGFEREAFRLSLSGSYAFDSGYRLTSISGYNEEDAADTRDFDATPRRNWMQFIASQLRDYSQEFRLTSPDDRRLRWLVGANYFHQLYRTQRPQYNYTLDFFSPGVVDTNKADTFGVFGSLAYDVRDDLTVSIEARYQSDKVDEGVARDGTPLAGTFRNFLPRVIVDWKPVPGVTLYASYAKGNKPGDFNEQLAPLSAAERQRFEDATGAGFKVDEEELENYELGVKGSLLDGRLFASLTGYYMKWKNQQVTVVAVIPADPSNPNRNPVTGTIQVGGFDSIGLTDLWGLEAEARWRFTDRFDVAATFAWAASEFKVYSCGFCAEVTGTTDVVGNHNEKYPSVTASLTASYRRSLADTGYDWFARADVLHTGRQYASPINLDRMADFTRANVRLGLSNERLSVEAYVTNLFDDDSLIAVGRFRDISNLASPLNVSIFGWNVTPAEKRTFGVRASYAF